MLIACCILLGLALFLLVVLFLPLQLRVNISRIADKTDFAVYAGLGPVQMQITPFLQKKRQKKAEKPKEAELEKKTFSLANLEKGISRGIEVLGYLKKKLTVSVFSIKVRFSLGDAADTGIATGAAYAAIYGLLGKMDRYFILKRHEVLLTPVFEGLGCEGVFTCTLRLRLLYGIGLILKIRKEDVK